MGEVKRTVCKETLDFLRGQIKWNKSDLGEHGEYIKTEYVYNLIDDMEKAMSSNQVRFNWPFVEETTQDGANGEMDESDFLDVAKERWKWEGNELIGHCGGTIAVSINPGVGDRAKIAAAPDMLEALEALATISWITNDPVIREVLENMEAVIKKARGGD